MLSNVLSFLKAKRVAEVIYLKYLQCNPNITAVISVESLTERINEFDLAIQILEARA